MPIPSGLCKLSCPLELSFDNSKDVLFRGGEEGSISHEVNFMTFFFLEGPTKPSLMKNFLGSLLRRRTNSLDQHASPLSPREVRIAFLLEP